MGAVDAQLVRATRQRMELHNVLSHHAIQRHGGFSVRFIDLLERAVHQVWKKRQRNAPRLPYRQRFAIQYRHVGLVYLPVPELLLQTVMRGLVLRHEEQPAGVHVQPVDD